MHVYMYMLHTYTVSRVKYTDEHRACIWANLGKFRYRRYESIRHPTDCLRLMLTERRLGYTYFKRNT